ncbi:MAG: ATP--guanido phosphotransferase [Oscillospiraceae bacterium]|nr:ATP--guanido phosphotransferase [Oscillospiraceae bacterium]
MKQSAVVSYRIRLARNLSGMPFPGAMSNQDKNRMIQNLGSFLVGTAGKSEFTCLMLDQENRVAARALMEKHRISPEFAGQDSPHAVVLSKDDTVSVMLGEEDSLRIQAFGGNLSECYQTAHRVEVLIDERFPLAFSEKLGFLTACPTNLGTGLRASALMHLPGLTESQAMRNLIQQASSAGLTIRGFYGEGTQAAWGYYQISNSVTLGLSEQEIIQALTDIAEQIDNYEGQARENIRRNDPKGFEDRLYRAYGLLTNARRISTNEAMESLSVLRMGIEEFPHIGIRDLDTLSGDIWPGALTEKYNLPDNGYLRDEKRAELLRESLVIK